MTSGLSVVVDANVIVAICAMEPAKLAKASAQLAVYARRRCALHAPGVIVAECLHALCRKLADGVLSTYEHSLAVADLAVLLASVQPPPGGDSALTVRAEQIRGTYGCSRSADGLYIALAENLAGVGPAEIVTFDAAMKAQANSVAPMVPVRLLTV